MRTFTPAQAAVRLGITDHAVRDMVRAGRLGNLTAAGRYPYSIPETDVVRVMRERRNEALRKVGDETEFARRIHRLIWPATDTQPRANGQADAALVAVAMSIPTGRRALPGLPENARKLWGCDVLTAAATSLPSGACRTCLARAAVSVHETLPVRDTEPFRVLLGQPCSECAKAFAAERRTAEREMRRLRDAERTDRDRRIISDFDERQRRAMAAVRTASAEFAQLVRERKRAGLPPLGGQR